jgi:hypothetical protein
MHLTRFRCLPLAVLAIAAAYLAFPFSAIAAPPPRAVPTVFTRYVDKTEGAFLLLIPKGWTTRGGMVRVNALTAGGAGNATDAKIDFTVARETEGRVSIRWLPKINYAQPSASNSMLGGNWNGMPIVAMPTAAKYLTGLLFPALHPTASGATLLETQSRPDAIASLQQGDVSRTMRAQGAAYFADAATATVTYKEGGTLYKELLFVALEGFAMQGVGLWSNPLTVVARAPAAEYDSYAAVAKVIFNSFALNPRWLQAEMKGQADRAAIVSATLREISSIDAEIARNRAETMSKINDQEYLTLTGQERYVNPHTGEEELGSNEWKYRWENGSGEVIYTDEKSWDPNSDPTLRVSGYKQSVAKDH